VELNEPFKFTYVTDPSPAVWHSFRRLDKPNALFGRTPTSRVVGLASLPSTSINKISDSRLRLYRAVRVCSASASLLFNPKADFRPRNAQTSFFHFCSLLFTPLNVDIIARNQFSFFLQSNHTRKKEPKKKRNSRRSNRQTQQHQTRPNTKIIFGAWWRE
jgi:hypothetical protein